MRPLLLLALAACAPDREPTPPADTDVPADTDAPVVPDDPEVDTSDAQVRAFTTASSTPAAFAAGPRGVPAYARGRWEAPGFADDPVAAARDFLAAHREVFGLRDPHRDLVPLRVVRNSDGDAAHFEQRAAGLRIAGADVLVSGDGGDATFITGSWWPDHDLPEEAPAPVHGRDALARRLDGRVPVVQAPPELIWFPTDAGLVLAWRALVRVDGHELMRTYADADFAVLDEEPVQVEHGEDWFVCYHPHTTFTTCNPDQDLWFVTGTVMSTWSLEADWAYDALQANQFVDYSAQMMEQRFGRASWDNGDRGVDVGVYVNYAGNPDVGGDNAMASAKRATLGFSPDWVMPDIVGHEYGHLVVAGSAGLVYRGWSGALNESYADFFGELSDIRFDGSTDWLVGTGIPGAPVGLRDFLNPDNYGHPRSALVSDAGPDPVPVSPATADTDWGGVHTNSGVFNRMWSLMMFGGTQRGLILTPIGVDRTATLAYTTLTTRLGTEITPQQVAAGLTAQADAFITQTYAGQRAHDPWSLNDRCRVASAAWAVGLTDSSPGDDDCDGIPNSSDLDNDGDFVTDTTDNCPGVANTKQVDTDKDGQGDVCDGDDDNDGLADSADDCPLLPGSGWVCQDDDGDTVVNGKDNCPTTPHKYQGDIDKDGLGDVCDPDRDGDGAANTADLCPYDSSTTTQDADGDGSGDGCDNCPALTNPDQQDHDGDGIGRACDPQDDPPPPSPWEILNATLITIPPGHWTPLPTGCPMCGTDLGRDGDIWSFELNVRGAGDHRVEVWSSRGDRLAVGQGEGIQDLVVPAPLGWADRALDPNRIDADTLWLRVDGPPGAPMDLSLTWR